MCVLVSLFKNIQSAETSVEDVVEVRQVPGIVHIP